MKVGILPAVIAALSFSLLPSPGAPGSEVDVTGQFEAALTASWAQSASGPRALAFSRDGDRLFVQHDYEFLLWRIDPPELLAVLPGSIAQSGDIEGPFTGMIASLDGRFVAAGTADSVRVWDGRTGEAVFGFAPQDSLGVEVHALAFTPEGRLLVGGSAGTVHVWDLEEGRQLARFSTYFQRWGALAANPLGAELAAGGLAEGRSPLALFDPVSGTKRRYLDGRSQDQVESLAYSPGGALLASGDDSSLEIWDPRAGERLLRLKSHGLSARTLAFSPEGDLIVCPGENGRLLAFDPASGELEGDWVAHAESGIEALAFAPGGRVLASAGRDGWIRIWRLSVAKR